MGNFSPKSTCNFSMRVDMRPISNSTHLNRVHVAVDVAAAVGAVVVVPSTFLECFHWDYYE